MGNLGYPTPEQRAAWKRTTDYWHGRRAVLAAHKDPMETWQALKEYDREWAARG